MKTKLAILLLAAGFAGGCVVPTKTTGFAGPRAVLPASVPRRVQVHISGQYDIARQAEEQFAAGLIPLGFELVNGDTIDGQFVGNMSAESSAVAINSHLSIRLVDTKTQQTIWSVEAHDPRAFTWSYAVQTSTIYSTRAALAALKKDLATLPP